MSDWIGTYSTAESIKAGLDLEMPYAFCCCINKTSTLTDVICRGPTVVRGAAVNRAIIAEKLFPEDIDARARNVRVKTNCNVAFMSGVDIHFLDS